MSPNKPLNLFPPQSQRRTPLSAGWRYRQAPASPDEEALFVRPEYDDTSWPPAEVPKQLAASTGNDTVWYRCRFRHEVQRDPARRQLLRFGGSFLETSVWLNGRWLGEHYGYFAPFAFDVTDHLAPGENVLCVRARATPEHENLKAKKHVMGIFADWDCKPYPNHALSNPPPGRVWTVPLGLWREVLLEETGPVVANWLRLTPEFADADWAGSGERLAGSVALRVEVELRNLVARPVRLALKGKLSPANFDGDEVAATEAEVELGPGEGKVHVLMLALREPALWWPWTHGEPRLYRLQLEAWELREGGERSITFATERTCGIREVRASWARSDAEQRWEWWLNGRRIFPKGSNYIAEFSLDAATPERYAEDLALAARANMDFIRVHAHIEKDEFYQQADELGLLVMCDFPLIFCYAFGAPEADKAFFRAAVLSQIPEMVNMLHHHPSIVLWAVHNEPPWPPDMYWFGEPHQAKANMDVDLEAAALVAALDSSRPAIAASGEYDEHLYNGWYHGSVYEARSLAPAFPTEFGAQALPNRDSPFWQTVATEWPIEPEEPSWRYADYQPVQWAQHGVGEPAAFATLDDYIEAGQDYQAFYCQYVVEHWRTTKFRPTGGLVHFLLTDCWPAITWSVLDYYRLPKKAYHALARAYNPTHVCLIFDGEYSLRDGCRIAYKHGEHVEIRFHVVNDDYSVAGPATLRWRIDPEPRGLPALSRLQLRLRGGLRGEQQIELPAAADGATLALRERRRLPRGFYTVSTELWQSGRIIDRNRARFCVDSALERPRKLRQVPGFATRRLYCRRSLRNADGGAVFCLRNDIQDATLEKVYYLRLDGAEVPLAQVTVDTGIAAVAAAAIGRRSPLVVRRGAVVTLRMEGLRLSPGSHTLELAVRIAGLGEGALSIADDV